MNSEFQECSSIVFAFPNIFCTNPRKLFSDCFEQREVHYKLCMPIASNSCIISVIAAASKYSGKCSAAQPNETRSTMLAMEAQCSQRSAVMPRKHVKQQEVAKRKTATQNNVEKVKLPMVDHMRIKRCLTTMSMQTPCCKVIKYHHQKQPERLQQQHHQCTLQ